MAMLLVTLGVMLLVVAGMSIGVLMGRKPIAGSCGGVGAALGEEDYVCELCGNDEAKCEALNDGEPVATTDLAVDATRRKD
ncbi:MAG TPA: (Na+)-NQR maturation NqrM [Cellvibrionaceae bacterium]